MLSSLRTDFDRLPVDLRALLQVCLRALGSLAVRDDLAFSLHTLVDAGGHRLGEVRALDANVDHVDAELGDAGPHCVTHRILDLFALHFDDVRLRVLSDLQPEFGRHDVNYSRPRLRDAPQRSEELQRVRNPPSGVHVDDQSFLVCGQQRFRRRVEDEKALLELRNAVDQRHLDVQPRALDRALRVAEPGNDCQLGFVDDDHGLRKDDRRKH